MPNPIPVPVKSWEPILEQLRSQGIIVFKFDSDMRFTGVQTSEGAVLYLPPKEFLGKPLYEVMPKEISQQVKERQSTIDKTGKPAAIIYSLNIGGKQRHFYSAMAKDFSGGYISFVVEITNVREAIKEGLSAKSMCELLSSYLEDLFYVTDAEGRIVFISENVSRYGYDPAFFIGKSFFTLLHKEDQKRIYDVFKEVAASNRPSVDEFRIPDAKGNYVWFEDNGRPLYDEKMVFQGFVGTLRDISKRKHLEHIQKTLEVAIDEISSMDNAKEALKKFFNCVVGLFDFDVGGIYFVDEKGGLQLFHTHNVPIKGKLSTFSSDTPQAALVRRGKLFYKAYNGYLRAVDGKAVIKGLTDVLIVPIAYKGEIIASVNFAHKKEKPLVEDEVKLIENYARELSAHIYRIRALQMLEESEKKYRSLSEGIQDVVFIVDAKGTIEYISPQVKAYKYSPEELVGKKFPGLLYKEDVKRVLADFTRIFSHRQEPTIRFRVVGGDGTVHWVDANGRLVSGQGILPKVMGTIRLVDDIVAAEQKLEAERERTKKYFDLAGDIVVVLDTEGRISALNKNGYQLLKYPEGSLTGKSWLELIPPSQRKNIQKVFEGIISSKNIQEYYENEVVCADGEIKTIRWHNDFIKDENGRIIGTISTGQDITSLIQARKEIGDYFRYTLDLLCIADAKGRILRANPQWKDVLGYSDSELTGTSILQYVVQEDRDFVEKMLKSLAAKDEVQFEARFMCKRSCVRWLEWRLRLREGKMYAIAREITARKEEEERLAQKARELEERIRIANEELARKEGQIHSLSYAKDEFIRNMTHELKTPLSVIMTNLYLLRDMAPLGREKEWMQMIELVERNAQRLDNDIHEILELTKLTTEKITTERAEIHEIVKEVYIEYLPLAERKGISLEIESEPIVAMCDKRLIFLAVSNLVSNAVKFTNQGGVKVSLKAEDGTYVITVSDTGIGIPKESKDKIFERFYKQDPNAPGTGIGLTLTKEIVERHGGTIEFSSTVGKGSTFTIRLPREGPKV